MPVNIWVVNASPLVVLAKIGQLDLLLAPNRALVIPEAVVEEIRAGDASDPARIALEKGFGGAPATATIGASIAGWGRGRRGR